ncbi:hypothetical protein ElyMa_002872300 [Elysia marginata]|uniref:Uncharacterized protein n=1 Tax=Elysia marginata TaxID=1093978 RepID=A0AAV4HX31_9GAST|nr:hypothetical protein ElyMa_002872300 [Elysia marginata]
MSSSTLPSPVRGLPVNLSDFRIPCKNVKSVRVEKPRGRDSQNYTQGVTDTNVRYGPRNMPREIASNDEVSYSMTNLDSALTMLMAVNLYGEEAVKDTKQIALGNTTGGVEHL